MSLLNPLSPITPTSTKRKPEKRITSPKEKRQERSEIDDMILTEQDEPSEDEQAEIEDSVADLDAREDGEEKLALLEIVSHEKFERNHPIEVVITIKSDCFITEMIKILLL